MQRTRGDDVVSVAGTMVGISMRSYWSPSSAKLIARVETKWFFVVRDWMSICLRRVSVHLLWCMVHADIFAFLAVQRGVAQAMLEGVGERESGAQERFIYELFVECD